MESIQYISKGYDIFRGNPFETDDNNVARDPGFGQHIFEINYSGERSADQRFHTPDGIEIVSCAGDCLTTFESSFIDGAEKYKSKLDLKVT